MGSNMGTTLTRNFCAGCDQWALVRDNHFLCCDSQVFSKEDLLNCVNHALLNYDQLSGVYEIKNKITGLVYIGQSSNLFERVASHTKDIKNQNHDIEAISVDAKAHGADSFKFRVLFLAPREELLKLEAQEIANRLEQGDKLYNRFTASFEQITERTRKKSDQEIQKPFKDREKLRLAEEQKFRALHKTWLASLSKPSTDPDDAA